jgi:23S rRNA pseudouridine2605 synthase
VSTSTASSRKASPLNPQDTHPQDTNVEETTPQDTNIESATEATPAVETAAHEPSNGDAPAEEPAKAPAKLAYGQSSHANQLATARAEHWHQDGKPLLSREGLRDWLNSSGLVLYVPRSQQLPMPAPSLVEATLGKANATPELADLDAAKNLIARLISEGSAVPLNLLGATGGTGTDVPDFVVSATVFSYIFTLRGNKAWKTPPATAGAVKVSPLALAAYEILSAKVTLTAYDLTTQLGKEVTEAAVLRALTELWSQLRVIPVPQPDGSPTLWELTSSRFTKQIKAGANAGQPSALSALISLYLAQALSATEDEIETFLSPLAPRSRVRDVIHALLSARQLETIVIDGKTLLHVAGDAPAFSAVAQEAPAQFNDAAEGGSRISKFASKPGSKIGTGLRSKPAFGKKPAFGSKPSYGKPAFGSGDRERRPFKRDDDRSARPSFSKPTFNKPWEEEKNARAAASTNSGESTAPAAEGQAEGGFAPRTFTPRTFTPRPGSDRPRGDRPSYGAKPGFGTKPRFEGRREGFSGGSNSAGDSRPPRREFTPRPDGDSGPRKTFSKPGTFGRKREGFSGKPSFDRPSFDRGDSRPPRRDFGAGDSRPPRRDFNDRGERPAAGGFKRPGSYAPRPSSDFGSKPSYGSKPSFGPKPSFGAKPGFQRDPGEQGGGSEAPRKVFRKFDAPRDKKPFGAKPFGARPFTPGSSARPPRTFDGPRSSDKPSAGTFDRPRGDRPARPSFDRSSSDRPSYGGSGSDRPRSDRPSFGSKPGGFGAKKPFSKSATFARSGSPFSKFAEGKKPFRKPGPSKSSGGSGSGPARRPRPEGGR